MMVNNKKPPVDNLTRFTSEEPLFYYALLDGKFLGIGKRFYKTKGSLLNSIKDYCWGVQKREEYVKGLISEGRLEIKIWELDIQ